MAKYTVKVESTKEYKEAIDAAETLGLEVSDVDAARYGWESPDADAVHPKGRFEIKKVGRTKINKQEKPINQYRWDAAAQDKLQDYLSKMQKMPCPEQHRAHIYNDPQLPEDVLGCKFCAEDGNHPELAKETVKECL